MANLSISLGDLSLGVLLVLQVDRVRLGLRVDGRGCHRGPVGLEGRRG